MIAANFPEIRSALKKAQDSVKDHNETLFALIKRNLI